MRKLIVLILILSSSYLFSQSINTEFGKNRVQFTDDFKSWDKYETENFVTYWYGKGKLLGKTVLQYAELDHTDIQDIMEHRMNDKIQIIVYLDVTDFKQSNIGTEDIFGSTTGKTKIVGNKMFVYFDGNHAHLREQIREGIARVYLNAILFGSSIQEIVQNAVLLKLPEWYKEGVVNYATQPWDSELDDELRDLLESNTKYTNFEKLAERHPKIAGHSMWYYIDQNYGRLSISNLLYLTRLSSNLDNSFSYVVNRNYEQLQMDWSKYWQDHYQGEKDLFEITDLDQEIDLKNKSYVPISQMKYSPDESMLLYVFNQQGKFRVMLRDVESGDEKTIMKYGHRNALQKTDYSYPSLAWHESNLEFSMVYEHRDLRYLRRYKIDDHVTYEEQLLPEAIRRVYSIDYITDTEYVMSANMIGYSDLLHYDAILRIPTPLTTDMHDDLSVQVIDRGPDRGVLFTSNRPLNWMDQGDIDTIVPQGNLDLFFLNLETKSIELIFDAKSDIKDPIYIEDGRVSYLSNVTGIQNQYMYDISSGLSTPKSNADRNIIFHAIRPNSNIATYTYYYDGGYRIFDKNIIGSSNPPITPYFKDLEELARETEEVPLIFLDSDDKTLRPEYMFQSQFPDPEVLPDIELSTESRLSLHNDIIDGDSLNEEELTDWNPARIVAGRKKFRIDNFATKFDNSVLFEGLENYNNPGDGIDLAALGIDEPANELQYAPNGILFQATVKDLFEDDVLVGGFRLPTRFNGSEFFLIYEDRKKLIDKKYSLYRRSFSETYESSFNQLYSTNTNLMLGEFQLKYPFDIFRSIRLRTSLRLDRYLLKSSDEESLDDPISFDKRLSIKAEYVYDNTIEISTNIKNGTRYKFYLEAINKFDLQVVDGFDFSLSEGFTSVLGFDFRHYIPLLRHSVLAFRGAGNASMGSEKILYYLGGIEGWIFQSFNQETTVPVNTRFAFHTAANQLRGFKANARNGGSFALINAELRLPIFKYLLGPNKGAAFFKDFQLTAFYDIGTAWHGFSPWSNDNPLNTVQVNSGDIITLNVRYFRNPLLMGYGTGIRTTVLGYLVKFDYAWGLENGQVQDPRFYFSVGADF